MLAWLNFCCTFNCFNRNSDVILVCLATYFFLFNFHISLPLLLPHIGDLTFTSTIDIIKVKYIIGGHLSPYKVILINKLSFVLWTMSTFFISSICFFALLSCSNGSILMVWYPTHILEFNVTQNWLYLDSKISFILLYADYC